MINQILQVATVPLYRYWNPGAGDHFYTTNWNELGTGNYGWGYEGIQCYVLSRQPAGSVPLYRYWNPEIADHFYTTNWGELGPGRYGWGYEGIQCYVFPQPAIPPSVEGGPEAESKSAMGETMPGPQASRGVPSERSGLPPTFAMGLATAPPEADETTKYVRSFATAKTQEGVGQIPRPASFAILGGPQLGQGKVRKSAGRIIININTGSSTSDDS